MQRSRSSTARTPPHWSRWSDEVGWATPTWVTSTPLMLVQPRENRDVKAAKNRHEVCLGWVQAAATFGGCNPIHEITND